MENLNVCDETLRTPEYILYGNNIYSLGYGVFAFLFI